MKNLIIQAIIAFISGVLFYLLVDYLINKFNENKKISIFTNDISTNQITYTQDYQKILTDKLDDNIGYDIVSNTKLYYVLPDIWTVVDIKDWMGTLVECDYSVIIEMKPKSNNHAFLEETRIVVDKEFIINWNSNPSLISNYILDLTERVFNYTKSKDYYIIIHYKSLMKVRF